MTADDKEHQFLDLLNGNKQLICKVCYMYANDADHFNDLYQEVVINIWQGLDKFRGDSQLSTWIYRTAINTCITYYRRNKSRLTTVPIDAVSDVVDDRSDRPSQLREMYRLIGCLNKLDKAIILLWLDEKSYDEISDIVGLTRNNVASRLRRIKAKLVGMGQE
jgi:RNA polymerase sigma-70 factor (ECF subfamily)